MLVAGSIESFRADTFRRRLAIQLPGVSPEDIELDVSASSLRVTVSITTSTAALARSIEQSLSGVSAASLTASLGVPVLSIDSVGTGWQLLEAPSPPSPAPSQPPTRMPPANDSPSNTLGSLSGSSVQAQGTSSDDSNGGMLSGVLGGVLGVLVLGMLIGAVLRYRHLNQKRREQELPDGSLLNQATHYPSLSPPASKSGVSGASTPLRAAPTADRLTALLSSSSTASVLAATGGPASPTAQPHEDSTLLDGARVSVASQDVTTVTVAVDLTAEGEEDASTRQTLPLSTPPTAGTDKDQSSPSALLSDSTQRVSLSPREVQMITLLRATIDDGERDGAGDENLRI